MKILIAFLLPCLLAAACQPRTTVPTTSPQEAIDWEFQDTLRPEDKAQIAEWEAEKETEIFASIDRWQISHIPDVIFKMPRLRSLSVSHCPVDSLDARIGNLTELTELRLVELSIRTFPPSFSKLTKLHTLELTGTCVTDQMWGQIASLPNLKVLIMDHCGLDLPANGPVPPRLDTLDMSGGGAMSGQLAILAHVKTLRYLDISGQGLTELPSDIRLLRQLKELRADHNNLNRLPAWLPELDSLETLSFGMEYLSSDLPVAFPAVLFEMKHLRSLSVSGNCTSVPDRFDEIPQLKELDLHLNITELPPSITRLDLERLDLSYCELATLPPGIQEMRGLRRLALALNDFGPDYLNAYFASAEFPELTYLSLSVTHLGIFPTAFCASSKLTSLDLHECGLEEEPPCLEGFKNLCEFNNLGNPYTQRPHKVKSNYPNFRCR